MARGIKGHEWTAAEDAVIREMLEGGSSVIDVCDRLGVDMVTMKNRLYALRKADPTFPRCMKTGRPSASESQTSDVPCERDVAAEGGSGDDSTGKLGELEQVLAEALAAKEVLPIHDLCAAPSLALRRVCAVCP
jgi:transposase-like protein